MAYIIYSKRGDRRRKTARVPKNKYKYLFYGLSAFVIAYEGYFASLRYLHW